MTNRPPGYEKTAPMKGRFLLQAAGDFSWGLELLPQSVDDGYATPRQLALHKLFLYLLDNPLHEPPVEQLEVVFLTGLLPRPPQNCS